MPAWRVEPASDELFEERATWRYEPPYDFYNDDGKPVKNPERFCVVRDEAGLVGFIYLEERAEGVFYGLGLRPELTGRGLGLEFVRLGLQFAHELFPGRRVILDVAEFNVRARKVYEKAGFDVVGRPHLKSGWGNVMFVDMAETVRAGLRGSRGTSGLSLARDYRDSAQGCAEMAAMPSSVTRRCGSGRRSSAAP